MSKEERQRATAGLAIFVTLCFLGAWVIAASLRVLELNVAPGPLGTRLLSTSLLYALTMGWQPVVATWVVRRWVDPPDRLDLGLRPARGRFYAVGGVGAICIAGAATLVAWLACPASGPETLRLPGGPEAELFVAMPSAVGAVGLALAFAATSLLVWTQAFSEEIGWRGYFLPRAMERLGRWRGLVVQGAVWGFWYAPVLFFTTYGHEGTSVSLGRCLAFVVSCVLIGTLLGWLRLVSKSVAPVTVANTTLTLVAGLPYVLHGVDAGPRSAAFAPVGWSVLALVIGALLLSRWRSAVQIPPPVADPARAPPPTAWVRIWLVLDARATGGDGRLLH